MKKPKTPTTYEINGYALRELRMRSGLAVQEFATQVDVTRAYVTKIELGHSRRVSPAVFDRILSALSILDRRSLLCNPHAVAEDQVDAA